MTLFIYALACILTALPATQTATQTPQQPSPPPAKPAEAKPADPADLPVSLEKIQKKLQQDPAIKVDILPVETESGLPTFRVQIDAPKLTIEQILGPDYLRGPVPYGGMTHQEFLDMVTPTDVKGYAAFTNAQGVTVALTSLALQWALKTALQELREAKNAHEQAAAKKEVQEALEALRKARREAGLPDK
jgi:hypothetical protein